MAGGSILAPVPDGQRQKNGDQQDRNTGGGKVGRVPWLLPGPCGFDFLEKPVAEHNGRDQHRGHFYELDHHVHAFLVTARSLAAGNMGSITFRLVFGVLGGRVNYPANRFGQVLACQGFHQAVPDP